MHSVEVSLERGTVSVKGTFRDILIRQNYVLSRNSSNSLGQTSMTYMMFLSELPKRAIYTIYLTTKQIDELGRGMRSKTRQTGLVSKRAWVARPSD